MEIDADKLIANALRDGVTKAVQERICGYNSPLNGSIDRAIESQRSAIESLLTESLESCLGDHEFRAIIADATRQKLAKVLVARFGGELEKRVNELKSDPSTRARITVAIDNIVKQSATAGKEG